MVRTCYNNVSTFFAGSSGASINYATRLAVSGAARAFLSVMRGRWVVQWNRSVGIHVKQNCTVVTPHADCVLSRQRFKNRAKMLTERKWCLTKVSITHSTEMVSCMLMLVRWCSWKDVVLVIWVAFLREAQNFIFQLGHHPFYLEMRDGAAHGVFLNNANGMDVALSTAEVRIVNSQRENVLILPSVLQPDKKEMRTHFVLLSEWWILRTFPSLLR